MSDVIFLIEPILTKRKEAEKRGKEGREPERVWICGDHVPSRPPTASGVHYDAL